MTISNTHLLVSSCILGVLCITLVLFTLVAYIPWSTIGFLALGTCASLSLHHLRSAPRLMLTISTACAALLVCSMIVNAPAWALALYIALQALQLLIVAIRFGTFGSLITHTA